MTEGTVNRYVAAVEFDPETFLLEFGGDFVDKELHVLSGLGMIVLELSTKAGAPSQASFPTYPIEWLSADGTVDVDQPIAFQVHRWGPTRLTLIDYNSTDAPHPYRFNVVVTYEGKNYGSDPVIINEPPGWPT
jgi:hypothetical protein